MSDPILDQPAYIEILIAVRSHMSLSHVAMYLESKPQNVSGWLSSQSVPTLKDFRSRLIEIGYYLKYIAQVDLRLGTTATNLLGSYAPELPPWGLSMVAEGMPPAIDSADIINPIERWVSKAVHNVRDLLPTPGPRAASTASPHRVSALTWQKLVMLKQFHDEDRSKQKQAPSKAPTPVLIWGEGCAGKSSLINALLGADLFPVSPVPDPPRLQILATDEKVLVEAPAFDGPSPSPRDILRLLRYLLASQDGRLFMVLSAQSFSTLVRSEFLAGMALLPCKVTLIFNKIDLYPKPEEQEQVVRFLTARFGHFHTVTVSAQRLDEAMLNELRNAAGLVGTARLKLVAAASAAQPAADAVDSLFAVVSAIIREVAGPATPPLSPDTMLRDLQLSDPQIGQILLQIEAKLGVSFADRDADAVLKGHESLGWLVSVVSPLLDASA